MGDAMTGGCQCGRSMRDVSHLPGRRLDERRPVADHWMKSLGKRPD